MDQKSFINAIQKESGLQKDECSSLLNHFVSVIGKSIASGDTISLPSFGSFEPRKRNERIMTQPSAPGKRFLIPPKIVVGFKPSAILKNRINNIDRDE